MNMEYLKVKQSTGVREVTDSLGIAKLYARAKEVLESGGTAELEGWLFSGTAYGRHVEYLRSHFSGLTLDVTNEYVEFGDSAAERVLAAAIGDGVGVTEADISAVTTMGALTSIDFSGVEYFHELARFTGVKNAVIGSNSYTGGDAHYSLSFPSCKEIAVPFTTIRRYDGLRTGESLDVFIAPYVTELTKEFGISNCPSLLYLGAGSLAFTLAGDIGMMQNKSQDAFRQSMFLYMPNVTSVSTSGDSFFGIGEWQYARPVYSIVYMKGTPGVPVTVGARCFSNCNVTNLVINNTALGSMSLPSSVGTVWVPRSLLTEEETVSGSVYTLTTPEGNFTNSLTYRPIEDFPTTASLETWKAEGKPVKLREAYM